jgi:hypothetical protein
MPQVPMTFHAPEKKGRSTLHSMHDTARTQLGLYINSSPHRPLRSIKQHCSISSFTISPDRLDSYCAGKKWSLLTSLFGFGCIQFHCACLFKLVIKTRGFVFLKKTIQLAEEWWILLLISNTHLPIHVLIRFLARDRR